MKPLRFSFIFLTIAAAAFSTGCSYFDAMLQSVENKIGSADKRHGTNILEDAKDARDAGNFAKAESYYQEYIEKHGRQADPGDLAFAHAQLGELAIRRNDFAASNRHFEESLNLNPTDIEVYGKYGESLFRLQDDHIRAETLFRQALAYAPNDTRFQLQLGRTLAHQKKYQAGLRYLKMSLGEQQAYDEIAQIYHQHGDYERAALAMTKSHEVQVAKQRLAQNGALRNPSTDETGYAVSSARPTGQDAANQAAINQQQEQLNALQQIVLQQQQQHVAQQQQPFPMQQQPVYTQQPSQVQPARQPYAVDPGHAFSTNHGMIMGPNDGFASSGPQLAPGGVMQQQPMPQTVPQQIVPMQATPVQHMPQQQPPMQQILVQQSHVPQSQAVPAPQYAQQYGQTPLTYTAQAPQQNVAVPHTNIPQQSMPQQTVPQQFVPQQQHQATPVQNGIPAGSPIYYQQSMQPMQNSVQNIAMGAPINPLSVQTDHGQTIDGSQPINPPIFYGFQSF